jgi:hypothetical protein
MTESTFSYTGKLNGQDLFTVRGNTVAEFTANLQAASLAVAAASDLQMQLLSRAGQTSMDKAINNLQEAGLIASPVAATVPASPQSIEVMKDKYGNEWTYGHPDAPDLPDGRGKYAKKKGTSKAGKAYVGWFDPAKGPKPFKPGVAEAETIWAKG